MSKGLGPTERFVLDQIEGKGHVDVGPVSRGDEWDCGDSRISTPAPEESSTQTTWCDRSGVQSGRSNANDS